MATKAQTLTLSPADLIEHRRTLMRTQRSGLPLGRLRTIAVGPDQGWEDNRPAHDVYIDGWGEQPQAHARGRMMDLSGQWLPIAQAGELILITATMVRADGYVGLPDLVDPLWHAPDFSEEEAMNPDCDANCRQVWDIDAKTGQRVAHQHIHLRGDKDKPKMVPQRLTDRHDSVYVHTDGTKFLVFRPCLRVTYQPEDLKAGDNHGFKPAEWKIEFKPDLSGNWCAFLCAEKTGECHFFGGIPVFGGDTRG
jgi:hypothetical protein